jgi:hypothetical protein
MRAFIAMCASGDFWSSRATGVPHSKEPEPLTFVWCANLSRREHSPFRIEPERGKVAEDVLQPPVLGENNVGDVLHEDESGSHVTDEAFGHRPQVPFITSAELPSRLRERLARETGSDEIHAATPRATVEGGEVRPDRRLIQVRLFHPCQESGRCVGVPLNVSHGSGGDSGESQGEFEASVAGAEVQGT